MTTVSKQHSIAWLNSDTGVMSSQSHRALKYNRQCFGSKFFFPIDRGTDFMLEDCF